MRRSTSHSFESNLVRNPTLVEMSGHKSQGPMGFYPKVSLPPGFMDPTPSLTSIPALSPTYLSALSPLSFPARNFQSRGEIVGPLNRLGPRSNGSCWPTHDPRRCRWNLATLWAVCSSSRDTRQSNSEFVLTSRILVNVELANFVEGWPPKCRTRRSFPQAFGEGSLQECS